MDKPNILLIFTDQQRADTIQALDNPIMRTPNLDRLCSDGIAFTNAYTPSPVCVPARGSMHYGQYPWNSRCYDNSFSMPKDSESFMQALTRAGFRVHGIGKRHFQPDPQALRGFQTIERQEEIVKHIEDDDYMKFLHDSGYEHILDPHGIRGGMYYVPQPAQMPAQCHPTQWIGDRVVRFIREQSKKKDPWFLFASFVHPHPPFAPPSPWHKLYHPQLLPLPNVPQDTEQLHTYINRLQNRWKFRDQGIDNNLLRCIKAYYYAAISFIDYQLGRILEVLEKMNQLDRTLVIFTSDHGEHLGDYNCFGKRSMHDTCARVPLILRMPGIFEGGTVCPIPVSLVDIAPTILSFAKEEIHTHRLDGENLADVVSGESKRQCVFSQYQFKENAIYMVANERWKYFYSAPDDKEFLFDRLTDPLETRNKVGASLLSSLLQDITSELKENLMNRLKKDGAEGAIEKDDWKRYPAIELPNDPDTGLNFLAQPWANPFIKGYSETEEPPTYKSYQLEKLFKIQRKKFSP